MKVKEQIQRVASVAPENASKEIPVILAEVLSTLHTEFADKAKSRGLTNDRSRNVEARMLALYREQNQWWISFVNGVSREWKYIDGPLHETLATAYYRSTVKIAPELAPFLPTPANFK
jgi:hypothetical protein